MRETINFDKPCVLAIHIDKPSVKTLVKMRLSDAQKRGVVFEDRVVDASKFQTLYVRLPIAPKRGDFSFTNPDGLPTSVRVRKIEKLPLPVHPSLYNSNDPKIKSFMKFIQEFSIRKNYLSYGTGVHVVANAFTDKKTGKSMPGYFTDAHDYWSDDKKFKIDYVYQCINRGTGKPSTTPLRISIDRGIIEAAAKYVRPAPSPYVVAWGAHEFGHFFLNTNPADEIEADLNSINICIGYGYGFGDVADAFLNVFSERPSDQNAERTKVLIDHLTALEKKYDTLK